MAARFEGTSLLEWVSLMGCQDFDIRLLAMLKQWIVSKHFSMLRMDQQTPTLLLCGTEDAAHGIALHCGRSYVKRFHVYDEFYTALSEKMTATDQIVFGALSAEHILFRPYRTEIYEQHGLIQRLCGVYRDIDRHPILFNLYRHKDQGFYSDLEIANFEQLLPIVSQIMQGHLALAEKVQHKNVKSILKQHQPLLTEQELEVCSRILKGMSYSGIAADLGLKESTIKTYRNRAFEKLGIHFKNQLFSLFMFS